MKKYVFGKAPVAVIVTVMLAMVANGAESLESERSFFLRAGDRVMLLGNSITAQAAAEKYGWKKDDGRNTFTMLKGGPTAGGGQGTWDVMFIRSKINPETKKPDPATLQQVMVQIDYDGNIMFPEIPQGKR